MVSGSKRGVAAFVLVVALSGLLVWTLGLAAGPRDAWRDAYRRPPAVPYPETNPFTEAKANLGRALFFDTSFSSSRTRSCASCHLPSLSWSDGQARARGEGATSMPLRSPTLLNVAWLDRVGWDGKFRDIESVAFRAILAPSNLNMTESTLIGRLAAQPAYVRSFGEAFPDKAINRQNIEKALATFERSIVSRPASFDRWVEGDEDAISVAAKRGFALFEGKARCSQCHSGWSFTDGSFHDVGLAKDDELGRGRYFPTSVKLQHAFKTPTLRDVALRAPYMHDGSIATLREVIEVYDKGGIDRPSKSEVMKPLNLSPSEKDDLIAFLRTLSGVDQPDR